MSKRVPDGHHVFRKLIELVLIAPFQEVLFADNMSDEFPFCGERAPIGVEYKRFENSASLVRGRKEIVQDPRLELVFDRQRSLDDLKAIPSCFSGKIDRFSQINARSAYVCHACDYDLNLLHVWHCRALILTTASSATAEGLRDSCASSRRDRPEPLAASHG